MEIVQVEHENGHETSRMVLKVLSQEIDCAELDENYFRILVNNQVRYIVVDPGLLSVDTLSFPPDFFANIPKLPKGDWKSARISRAPEGLVIKTTQTGIDLVGIECRWHPTFVDVLSFVSDVQINFRVREVQFASKPAISKIARFPFEIPRMENETAIYEAIAGHDVGPAFLGHLVEHDRIMGILIEKVEGTHAGIEDLQACQTVVRRLHSLGIVHGDLNRYNFVITEKGATLIDFENATIDGDQSAMDLEYSKLSEQLREETGRGGPARPMDDSE